MIERALSLRQDAEGWLETISKMTVLGMEARSEDCCSSTGSVPALETSVRQLIANGKTRSALENANQFQKVISIQKLGGGH